MSTRRRAAIAVGVVLTISASGIANASHSNNNGGPHDFVSGHVKRSGNLVGAPNDARVDASISAHRLADGTATGHVEIKNNTGTSYGGDVVCLTVLDNNATVGFQITHDTRDPANVGQYQTVRVHDGGNPGHGKGDSRDFFSPGAVRPVPPVECGVPPVVSRNPNGLTGNFIVHDA